LRKKEESKRWYLIARAVEHYVEITSHPVDDSQTLSSSEESEE